MTSKTRAQLTTEQTAQFADNTTGAITPAVLRGVIQDMIDSTGTLLDANGFASSVPNSFPGGVIIASTASLVGGTVSTSTLIIQSTSGSTPGTDQILVQASNITVKGLSSAPSTILIGAAGSSYGSLGIAGSTSGSTTIVATGAASGTQTLQAASDTFVYLSTTDTLNNKTIGSALAFNGSTSGSTALKATAAASGTLTLPAAIDTLIGKATTDILTNKTFNSAGTGNTLQVSGVTVSSGQYPGTTTNDNATSGNVGEDVVSSVSSPGVSLATGSAKTMTSIIISAGDWDVWTTPVFQGTASPTLVRASISTVASTESLVAGRFIAYPATLVLGTSDMGIGSLMARLVVSTSTTVYCVVTSTFGSGTCTAYGNIEARRRR